MPRVGAGRGRLLDNSGSDDDCAAPLGGGSGGRQDEQAHDAVFTRYIEASRALSGDIAKDQVFDVGLGRVRDYLSSGAADSSCCLICLGAIRHTEAIWHCRQGCHAVLHLVCLQEWARSQLDTAAAKAASRLQHFPQAAAEARAAAEWGCPKCRTAYAANDVPSRYTCFCGKVTDPEFDPWITPHTCGDTCGRPLPGGCGHACLLLCHPGPCPPCPLVVDAGCYCGKAVLKRRCGHDEFGCGAACGARLGCGHSCPEECHPGPCPPCQRMGQHACSCGAETRRLACCDRTFQCARVCDRALPCGNHACERVCHAGPCGGCPLSERRTCPCGKVRHEGLSCLDKPPTCGSTCGKLLPCGSHYCNDRCHYGECSVACKAPVVKTCRCGRNRKEMLCSQGEYTCERRCNELRACGRHPCKRRCCDGDCPPCEEVCGRRLRCGHHKCPSPCHSGPCRPCPLSVAFSCACAGTTSTLPCGAEGRAAPPLCFRACPVPRLCRHREQLPRHRCHYDGCPPCELPCGTELPCGHACPSPVCHDPQPPAVAPFQLPLPPKPRPAGQAGAAAGSSSGGNKRSGSGAADAAAGGPPPSASGAAAQQASEQLLALVKAGGRGGSVPSPCPRCSVPLQRTCAGGHVTLSVPCSQARAFSCGAPCGRPLQCGNHVCAMPCHAVPPGGASSSSPAPVGGGDPASAPVACRQCDRACGRPRSCQHACPQACHNGPCVPCAVQVRSPCRCGKTTLHLPCHVLQATASAAASGGGGAGSDALRCAKPCHRELPNCPHPCRAVCHGGPCPDPGQCADEVSVRCDCKRQKAKWACSRVQDALAAQGKGRAYSAATQLRLLPCDAECERQRQVASKQPVQQQQQQQQQAAGAAAAARAASDAAVPAAEAKGSKQQPATKLTRAERDAQAAKREAERVRRARLQGLVRGLVLALIAVLGVLLALAAKTLLRKADESARAKWGTTTKPPRM